MLTNGGVLNVTTDHPFWVDSGQQLDHAGWLQAGQLRAGDRLRTASGAAVIVAQVRYGAGYAAVYTLTVAQDHTFFVGHWRVLVHNSLCDSISQARQNHILPGEENITQDTDPSGKLVTTVSYGGGHRSGTGFPGKTESPSWWPDWKILQAILEVGTDPASTVEVQNTKYNGKSSSGLAGTMGST